MTTPFSTRFRSGTLAAALVFASAGGAALSSDNPDRASFTLRVQSPSIAINGLPGRESEVKIEGFNAQQKRPGAPDLPEKLYRVAIPPGVTPRLEIVPGAEELRRNMRPRAVAEVETDLYNELDPASPNSAGGSGLLLPPPRVQRHEVRREKAEWFAGPKTYPERIAWLGETGVLRDQRYVEVHVAPVRFDPRINGLRIASDYQVIVHFDGDTLDRKAPVDDPRFETIYRNAFANYAQGKTFRLGAQASDGPAPAPMVAAATGPIRRIKIRQNGIVRLDSARMSTTTGFLSANFSTWRLTNRGVEVPLEVNDVNGNDLMDSGDWVQFYGQALDDEPKAVLNTDLPGTPIDIFEARDFTDENVYFLTTETGVTHARMPAIAAAPTNTRVPPNDFASTAHAEIDSPDGFRPLSGNDPWYWTPTISSPIPLGSGLLTARTDTVNLPGLASPTMDAEVVVKVRGLTELSATAPDHHSRVTLKTGAGTTLLTNDDDGTFDGRNIYVHDFTYHGTGAGLTNPAKVTLDTFTVAGTPSDYYDQMILDWIEIRYRRLFQAASDVLTFDYPDGDAEFIVSGLTTGSPEIYELTGKVGGTGVLSPVRLTGGTVSGAGPFSVRFRVDNDPTVADGTNRRFVVFGTGAVAPVADPDFAVDTVSDLRNNANQADMIVIAHPTVLGASSQSTLNQLLGYHATKGITSKIVMLQDVYDEFNDGLPGPGAIKNFLKWVMSTNPGEGWANPKPAYVMILGDGSYDYKAGEPNGNFVPTQIMFLDDPSFGYYASDNSLAAVVGTDPLADLVVGRIVSRTDGEDNTVLAKTLAYHMAPPAGNWRQHVTVASDRGKRGQFNEIDPSESLDFELTNATAIGLMKLPPFNVKNLRYYSDFCDPAHPAAACDEQGMNDAIRWSVNGQDGFDGAAVWQYVGHGNADIWSDDAYWKNLPPTPDPETLTNGTKLPWLLAHGCLIGDFQGPNSRSMGENWLKRLGGGAVAVFGPSGLTFNFVTNTVSETVFGDLYGAKQSRTVAEPVMDSWSQLCGQGSTQGCQMYVLLGDPAIDLVIPSVAPATNLQATAGATQQLSITWTASTSPSVTYNVWRTTNLASGGYTKINAAPLAVTNFLDTALVNGWSYYYYVVATNNLGFDSRWSNFNSDCAVNGPDCVRGIPLNPSAPAAPASFTLTDAESSGKLLLSWAANGEPDLSFYTIHYGLSSGNYTVHLGNARATTAVLNGLANGTRYYVTVTATNTSNKTSAYAVERNEEPTFVRGVRSPALVNNLTLAKSGSDIVLSWSPVTTTIYNKTASIARYEVYRGTSLSFLPGPSNLISAPSQTGTSFTDLNALSSGGNYYYVVRAVDAQGNGGGLGNQLPMGIDGLTVRRSTTTPGNVVLSWPPVATAFSSTDTPGAALPIDHYEVYARPTAFSRGDIRDNLVPLVTSTANLTIELTPPASTQFYSVVAVDARGNKSPF